MSDQFDGEEHERTKRRLWKSYLILMLLLATNIVLVLCNHRMLEQTREALKVAADWRTAEYKARWLASNSVHDLCEATNEAKQAALICGMEGYAAGAKGLPVEKFFSAVTNSFEISGAVCEVHTNDPLTISNLVPSGLWTNVPVFELSTDEFILPPAVNTNDVFEPGTVRSRRREL